MLTTILSFWRKIENPAGCEVLGRTQAAAGLVLSVDVELGPAVVERGLVEDPRPLSALVVGQVRPHVVIGCRRLLPALGELDEDEQRVAGNRAAESHSRLLEGGLGGRAHLRRKGVRLDERLLTSVLLRPDGATGFRRALSTATRNLVSPLGGGGVAERTALSGTATKHCYLHEVDSNYQIILSHRIINVNTSANERT